MYSILFATCFLGPAGCPRTPLAPYSDYFQKASIQSGRFALREAGRLLSSHEVRACFKPRPTLIVSLYSSYTLIYISGYLLTVPHIYRPQFHYGFIMYYLLFS